MKKPYIKPTVDYKVVRKSITIPDQTLSIQEIVTRFSRGINVDVIQRQTTYTDQVDYDLEKLSRMDFGDKAAFAAELEDFTNATIKLMQAREQARAATAAKEATIKTKVKAKKPGIVVP